MAGKADLSRVMAPDTSRSDMDGKAAEIGTVGNPDLGRFCPKQAGIVTSFVTNLGNWEANQIRNVLNSLIYRDISYAPGTLITFKAFS